MYHDGLVIHSWGSPNCSFIFFYSPLLKPEGLGKWLTDSTTRWTHCQAFPLNLVPIHLFPPLSLWCKCTGIAWLSVPLLVRPQKISWNNTACSECTKIKRFVFASVYIVKVLLWDISTWDFLGKKSFACNFIKLSLPLNLFSRRLTNISYLTSTVR